MGDVDGIGCDGDFGLMRRSGEAFEEVLLGR